MQETVREYWTNTTLNKSQHMANKQDGYLNQTGYEKVKSYKYLGVWINTRGSVIEHYNKTKGWIVKLCWRLQILDKLLPLRHINYGLSLKPYFDYISTLLWMWSSSLMEKYTVLWRKSLKSIHRNFNVRKNGGFILSSPFLWTTRGLFI